MFPLIAIPLAVYLGIGIWKQKGNPIKGRIPERAVGVLLWPVKSVK